MLLKSGKCFLFWPQSKWHVVLWKDFSAHINGCPFNRARVTEKFPFNVHFRYVMLCYVIFGTSQSNDTESSVKSKQTFKVVWGSLKYSATVQNGCFLCCFATISIAVYNVHSFCKFVFCERISLGFEVNPGKLWVWHVPRPLTLYSVNKWQITLISRCKLTLTESLFSSFLASLVSVFCISWKWQLL